MEFSQRIKTLRDEKEATQAQVAKAIGVSERVYSYYEAGDRFPKDPELLEAIADYYNVSADYLLGRSNVRKPELPDDVIDIAFHQDYDQLSDEGKLKVLEYIELMKLKYKKKK